MDRESEIEVLKEEAASLEKTLKNINERLATLQGGSSAGSERKG
jgi:predicted  nucleic acid-binding Zn-ribbon protein